MNTRARTRTAGRHRILSWLATLLTAALVLGTPAPYAAATQSPVGGALLGSKGVVRPEGMDVPRLPKVRAASYVVTDLDKGKVLAAKNAHGTYAPASTIKVLTALATLPHLKAGEQVKPNLSDMSVDGTKVGVDRRRSYPARSLYQAMLMMSANDAAEALARAAGGKGGKAKTIARMNAIAKRLQAGDTVARKPSGLDAKGQSSSAYDLSLIFRAAMQNEDFRKYTATKQARFPDLKKNKTFQISSHNRMLFDYPGTVGGKNGFTSKALASYVGAVKDGNRTIGVAVMKTPGAALWSDTKKLLDWGVAARSKAVPVGDLVAPRGEAKPSASASAEKERRQAVTPVEDSTGLPPWLMPVALAAAVVLCALVAGMAISSRRQPAPARAGRAGGSRRRGSGNRARRSSHGRRAARRRAQPQPMQPQPVRPQAVQPQPAQPVRTRGHGRRTQSRRTMAAPRRVAHESSVTVTYPMWPSGQD